MRIKKLKKGLIIFGTGGQGCQAQGSIRTCKIT